MKMTVSVGTEGNPDSMVSIDYDSEITDGKAAGLLGGSWWKGILQKNPRLLRVGAEYHLDDGVYVIMEVMGQLFYPGQVWQQTRPRKNGMDNSPVKIESVEMKEDREVVSFIWANSRFQLFAEDLVMFLVDAVSLAELRSLKFLT